MRQSSQTLLSAISVVICMSGCVKGRENVPVSPWQPKNSGVGAIPPAGSIMLFDGSQGRMAAQRELAVNWHAWWRFNLTGHPPKDPAAIGWEITKDPQFPNDTNRVALRMYGENTPGHWGYHDIQAKVVHGDARIHVEWIAMGRYDTLDTENPDSVAHCNERKVSAPCYFNSGVYIQSRYEVQLQAYPQHTSITGPHSLGSLVDEYAPTANPHLGNGRWQAFDILFRAARWRGATKTADAILSVWWNGVQIHTKRHVLGKATGLANHSGEEINDTLYGLKLQAEMGDVRFRNVWMKKFTVDSIENYFGE